MTEALRAVGVDEALRAVGAHTLEASQCSIAQQGRPGGDNMAETEPRAAGEGREGGHDAEWVSKTLRAWGRRGFGHTLE